MIDICEEERDGEWDDGNLVCGTVTYTGYMTQATWESYFEGYCGEGAESGRDKYYMPLPVWTGGNIFFNGAKHCDIEEDFTEDTEHKVTFEVKEEDGKFKVVTNVMDFLPEVKLIDSDTLGMAFEPEERFEEPDGSDIIFDTDFYGNKREGKIVPGPIAK